MRSRRERYKYRMMVPDQWRVPQQDGQWGILLPRVCTMKDPHKVVPIYGLAIGGL